MRDGNLQRIKQIQRELTDIDKQQKNLLQELYSLIGLQPNTSPFKTGKNRLTKDQFRRLCGA